MATTTFKDLRRVGRGFAVLKDASGNHELLGMLQSGDVRELKSETRMVASDTPLETTRAYVTGHELELTVQDVHPRLMAQLQNMTVDSTNGCKRPVVREKVDIEGGATPTATLANGATADSEEVKSIHRVVGSNGNQWEEVTAGNETAGESFSRSGETLTFNANETVSIDLYVTYTYETQSGASSPGTRLTWTPPTFDDADPVYTIYLVEQASDQMDAEHEGYIVDEYAACRLKGAIGRPRTRGEVSEVTLLFEPRLSRANDYLRHYGDLPIPLQY